MAKIILTKIQEKSHSFTIIFIAMEKATHPITVFTPKDADRFLEEHREKTGSIEATLLKNDLSLFVTNLKAGRVILSNGSVSILATLNKAKCENTHICSPYNAYITYAKAYADHFNSLWAKLLIITFTKMFGKLFQWTKIDKIIQLNNTISTINLHSTDLSALIPDIVLKLKKRYPKYTIMVPRLNQIMDSTLFTALKNGGFVLIPTKMVHIYDPEDNYLSKRNVKADLSLLKKRPYQIVYHDELSSEDIKRIRELYEMLFIKKHSRYAPDLTIHYFQQCYQHRWFEFIALRNQSGIIDAFISYARMNGGMICGPLGYDTTKPREMGLLRMIISLSLDRAKKTGSIYNLGSGNEKFKLMRGSHREIEYNAIYYQHLPFYRQLPWKIIAWFSNRFLVKLFKKHLI
ncbi:MAG: hypothetical protein PWK00_04475 [Coxiella burnetii]|nr:hypothetical protein [Coxiella burnetii]